MYQAKTSLFFLMILCDSVKAATSNLGLSKTQVSLTRAHCKYSTTSDSLNARHVSSASLHLSGGGSGSISLTNVEIDGEKKEKKDLKYLSSDLNDFTLNRSKSFPDEEEDSPSVLSDEEQKKDYNDEQDSLSTEIVRGGDGSGMATMKQSQITSKPSFTTGKASILQEKKTQRLEGRSDNSHLEIAKKLKNRNDMNIKRKVIHAGSGLFFATLNQILPRSIFLPGMSVVSTVVLGVELLRYRKGFGFLNDFLHFSLGGSLRKHEMEGKFTGGFYYLSGVTLTSALFPKSCASLGICQLALADPSASFFGRKTRHIYWSRIQKGFFGLGRNKGILGFLGGALICFPLNYRLLSIAKYGSSFVIPGGQINVALASLALGVAGAFADLCVPTPALTVPKEIRGIKMPPFHVDDNIVVPILSGFACTKIFQGLGWTQGVALTKFLIL